MTITSYQLSFELKVDSTQDKKYVDLQAWNLSEEPVHDLRVHYIAVIEAR